MVETQLTEELRRYMWIQAQELEYGEYNGSKNRFGEEVGPRQHPLVP